MKTEPLVTLASITAGATALLGLLVAFGVPLTEGQQVAVLAVVAVAAPFVVALAGRGQVTPNASVVELALPVNTPGKRLVVAGEANEIETGKTIRVLEDDPSDPGAGRRRGRRTHGGEVLPKPEKDNGLGRVLLGRRRSHPDGIMVRRRILTAAMVAALAVGVLPAVTSSEAQAATVCKDKVSNSPLKGRGQTICTGMPKGTYQRAKLWCADVSKPAYGNWAKSGEWSYAYCTIVGNTALFADIQFRKG